MYIQMGLLEFFQEIREYDLIRLVEKLLIFIKSNEKAEKLTNEYLY